MKRMLPFLAVLTFCTLLAANGQPVPNMPSNGATDQPINPTLGWRALSAIPTYEVEYGADPEFQDVEILTTESSQIEVENLDYSTLYYWHVRGLDTEGNPSTEWSATQSFTTKSSKGIPQPVSPADGETDVPLTATLIWTPGAKGDEHEIEYDINGFADPVHQTVSGTAYTLTGLDYGQTVTWRVRSMIVGAAPGEWSRYSSFTTEYRKPDPLSPPRLLSPSNGAAGLPEEVVLTWGDVPGKEIFYGFEVALDPQFDSVVAVQQDLDSTSTTLTALDQGETYYWRAMALNDETKSPWSAAWSFTVAEIAKPGLLAPELLSPQNNAQEIPVDPLLTWDSVDGATFYQVEIGRDGSFASSDTLLTLDSTSAPFEGLEENETYYWRARGGDETRMSGWSKPYRFTTISAEVLLPERPVLISPSDSSSDLEGEINFSWALSQHSLQYFIQLSTTGLFDGEEEVYTEIDLDMTLEELKPGLRYFWRVQGMNQYGESAWSETWSFTTKEEASGVNDAEAQGLVPHIYPIPATDLLSVDISETMSSDAQVDLVSSLGQVVMSASSEEGRMNGGKIQFRLDSIPSGLYYCRIQSEEGVMTYPVIVLR